MRFEKAENLLQLAIDMQASRVGLSLQDIQERFGVGRRTAMRMRDSVIRKFPQAEEVQTSEKVKRWRIPPGVLDRLVSFSAEELADLEAAVALYRRENLEARAVALQALADKIRALMRPEAARKVEPDLEALLEAEGIAMRPGPRPRMRALVVDELRQAIKACRKVVLLYRSRQTRKVNRRLVWPYGFLFGHRHYLVAFHENPKANKVALFSLPNIEKVELTDDAFVRDPTFSLKDFAERSFGVFQEEPFDVVWRFSAEAAEIAREFLFHPTQVLEPQADGTLIVHFRAGSDLEMAWHLCVWGEHVEVIEPKRLADMVNGYRRPWPALP